MAGKIAVARFLLSRPVRAVRVVDCVLDEKQHVFACTICQILEFVGIGRVPKQVRVLVVVKAFRIMQKVTAANAGNSISFPYFMRAL